MIPLYLLIAGELILVSYLDLKTKKISNYWVLVNFCIAVISYLLGIYQFEWSIFLYPLTVFIVGFALFLVQVMGAGDSKYLASLFLLLPYHYHQSYLENVLLSTILVGAILIITKLISRFSQIKGYALSFHFKGVLKEIRSHFSYAPVLLLAWLLLGRSIW